jgi:hypothetical protein
MTDSAVNELDDFQAGYEFGYADGTVGEYRKPRRRAIPNSAYEPSDAAIRAAAAVLGDTDGNYRRARVALIAAHRASAMPTDLVHEPGCPWRPGEPESYCLCTRPLPICSRCNKPYDPSADPNCNVSDGCPHATPNRVLDDHALAIRHLIDHYYGPAPYDEAADAAVARLDEVVNPDE